jgi:hypothetical protein
LRDFDLACPRGGDASFFEIDPFLGLSFALPVFFGDLDATNGLFVVFFAALCFGLAIMTSTFSALATEDGCPVAIADRRVLHP